MADLSILGNLVFTSIGDLRIHKNDLEQIFAKNGLSLTAYQPGDIRPSDAMRRATSKLKLKKVPIKYKGNDSSATIDVTESLTASGAVRYIGRKVIAEFMQTVDYEQISTFIFERSTGALSHTSVDQIYHAEYDYESILKDTENLYNEYCNYHNKETIRNIILRIVNSCMPTLIKPVADEDSVAKFIPHVHVHTINAMRAVILDLKNYHINGSASGCQFIELFDSEANKTMIETCLKNDVKTKVTNLVSELTDILKQRGAITLEKGKILVTQLKTIRDEVKTYSDLLGVGMDVLEKQIATAITRVELPENYNPGGV
jgi:hypothetical protein